MQRLRSTRLIAGNFCLLLVLSLGAPQFVAFGQTATTTQQQPARPALPPRQYIPDRNYDTRHIKLDLRFDWEREQAFGTATITFTPLLANTGSVEFDAANMAFSSVKLASGTPLKFETDAPREKLRITLDRVYQPADVLTVVISYNTNGVSQEPGLLGGQFGRGLSFIKPSPKTRPARSKSGRRARPNIIITGSPATTIRMILPLQN